MTFKKSTPPPPKGPGAGKRPGPPPQPAGKQVVIPVVYKDLSKKQEAPKPLVIPVSTKKEAPQPAPARRPEESS